MKRLYQMKFLTVLGRVMFALMFVVSGSQHFTQGFIDYGAAKGIWQPEFLVPASGLLAVLGGISIAIGYKTRAGALLIIIFLLPVTLIMHNFWALQDPMERAIQTSQFMKNISMLGGAILIAYFGAGAYSIDEATGKKEILPRNNNYKRTTPV